MKNLLEVREHLVTKLNLFLKYPGPFNEDNCKLSLEYLAFIDEKEEILNQLYERNLEFGLESSIGVEGAFKNIFGSDKYQFYHEVSSIYAEIAFKLGHLEYEFVDNNIFKNLKMNLKEVMLKDWTISSFKQEFGSFSWATHHPKPWCPCTLVYFSSRDKEWLYFDFNHSSNSYNKLNTDEVTLRNCRIAEKPLVEGLLFSPNFSTHL